VPEAGGYSAGREEAKETTMSINNSSGFRSTISAAVAVALTSALAYSFASSTAKVQWLGSDAVSRSASIAQVPPEVRTSFAA
jgi:hypothetical protein